MSMSKPVDSAVALQAESGESSAANADQLLVERVQDGDVAAFDVLVRKYRERLYGIIYNLTSNREDAADLTQEAFIKAFSSLQGAIRFFHLALPDWCQYRPESLEEKPLSSLFQSGAHPGGG
jgi:hypothetical protein